MPCNAEGRANAGIQTSGVTSVLRWPELRMLFVEFLTRYVSTSARYPCADAVTASETYGDDREEWCQL